MEAIEKEMLSAREAFDLRHWIIKRCEGNLTKAESWYRYSIGDMAVDTETKILLSAREAFDLRQDIVMRCASITESEYCYRFLIGDSEAVKDYENFKQKEKDSAETIFFGKAE